MVRDERLESVTEQEFLPGYCPYAAPGKKNTGRYRHRLPRRKLRSYRERQHGRQASSLTTASGMLPINNSVCVRYLRRNFLGEVVPLGPLPRHNGS